MALSSTQNTRQLALCPACGYPTLDARLCAVCTPLAVSFGFTGNSAPVIAAAG